MYVIETERVILVGVDPKFDKKWQIERVPQLKDEK